jgi:hypothetical protein
VNTSSVNGFWASLGPGMPHTAYSAAKFAVKGFTEALITDFRSTRRTSSVGRDARAHRHLDRHQLGPHAHGRDPKDLTEEACSQLREHGGAQRSGSTCRRSVADEDIRARACRPRPSCSATAPR